MFKPLMSLLLTLGIAAGAHADATTPDQALRGTTEKIQNLIKDNYKTYRKDLPTFYKAVDDVVVPRFDVPYITQLVLATHYKGATPPSSAARFSDVVQEHAGARLRQRHARQLRFDPGRVAAGPCRRREGAGQHQHEHQRPARSTLIGFRVRKVADDWKVFDIAVENVSLVTNFRTQLECRDQAHKGLDDGDRADGKRRVHAGRAGRQLIACRRSPHSTANSASPAFRTGWRRPMHAGRVPARTGSESKVTRRPTRPGWPCCSN